MRSLPSRPLHPLSLSLAAALAVAAVAPVLAESPAVDTKRFPRLVRVFLLHHMTWSINSVCHFFGRRRFDTDDESRNVAWLALPTFGEAWHHNHHAFPTSAFHGLRVWERLMDPAGLLIVAMEKAGLVWDVKRVPLERQREKAVGAAA